MTLRLWIAVFAVASQSFGASFLHDRIDFEYQFLSSNQPITNSAIATNITSHQFRLNLRPTRNFSVGAGFGGHRYSIEPFMPQDDPNRHAFSGKIALAWSWDATMRTPPVTRYSLRGIVTLDALYFTCKDKSVEYSGALYRYLLGGSIEPLPRISIGTGLRMHVLYGTMQEETRSSPYRSIRIARPAAWLRIVSPDGRHVTTLGIDRSLGGPASLRLHSRDTTVWLRVGFTPPW